MRRRVAWVEKNELGQSNNRPHLTSFEKPVAVYASLLELGPWTLYFILSRCCVVLFEVCHSCFFNILNTFTCLNKDSTYHILNFVEQHGRMFHFFTLTLRTLWPEHLFSFLLFFRLFICPCTFLTLAAHYSLTLSFSLSLSSNPPSPFSLHMQTGLTTIVKSAHMIKWYTGTRRNSCGRWLGRRPGIEAGGQTLAFNHRGR